jgi:hypothetical protein
MLDKVGFDLGTVLSDNNLECTIVSGNDLERNVVPGNVMERTMGHENTMERTIVSQLSQDNKSMLGATASLQDIDSLHDNSNMPQRTNNILRDTYCLRAAPDS